MITQPMLSGDALALGVLVVFALIGVAALVHEIARRVRRKMNAPVVPTGMRVIEPASNRITVQLDESTDTLRDETQKEIRFTRTVSK